MGHVYCSSEVLVTLVVSGTDYSKTPPKDLAAKNRCYHGSFRQFF